MAGESETTAHPATATFELKQFAWLTPDRLGVSGRFAGLQEPANGAPVLVIRAGERVLRLPVVADSLDGSPGQGGVWQAAFEWRDAPVAFDAARLELGDAVVDLPELDGKRRLSRKRVLEVRTLSDGGEPPVAELPVLSQVELVAAQEEAREARVVMEQTQQELARAREDLRAERELRSADSERFREALVQLRGTAEQALAGEQSANRRLTGELREARAEADALRKRVDELDRDGKEIDRLHAELDRTRARADVARTELEKARGVVEGARGDAEKLIARLTADHPK